MKIHSESRIAHPLDKVYDAYCRRLPEIARFMPDIKEIRIEDQSESDGKLKLRNRWLAQRDLPQVAQKIVKPEMMQWIDHAEWTHADHSCAWTLELPSFNKHFQCSGSTKLTADGEGTRVVLDGDLRLDLKGFPGIPRLLAGKVTPAVEEFIVKLVRPNLEKTNDAVGQLLDAG